jgi:methanogenic corrinoid protein MtbC1
LALDRVEATRLLSGVDDNTLRRIEQVVVPAMERIGDAWEQGSIALSQVYMSGRICEDLVEALLPDDSEKRKGQPTMAVAVLEDYHLLGKRMVYAAIRASGYTLKDYGRMGVAALVQRARADRIDILLISALMLPSALRVAAVRESLDRAGCRARIVVGGAPFRLDEELWREVGADAMGRSASDAMAAITGLVGKSP